MATFTANLVVESVAADSQSLTHPGSSLFCQAWKPGWDGSASAGIPVSGSITWSFAAFGSYNDIVLVEGKWDTLSGSISGIITADSGFGLPYTIDITPATFSLATIEFTSLTGSGGSGTSSTGPNITVGTNAASFTDVFAPQWLWSFNFNAGAATGMTFGIGGVTVSCTYTPVTFTDVFPAAGAVGGGNTVTLVGSGFLDAVGLPNTTLTNVWFDFNGTPVAATGVSIVDNDHITCIAPAHASGVVDVCIEFTNSATGNLGDFVLVGGYNYGGGTPLGPNGPPIFPDVTTTSGSNATIPGGFPAGSTVTVGGVSATVIDPTTGLITLPAHTPGPATIVIVDPTGAKTIYPAGVTYMPTSGGPFDGTGAITKPAGGGAPRFPVPPIVADPPPFPGGWPIPPGYPLPIGSPFVGGSLIYTIRREQPTAPTITGELNNSPTRAEFVTDSTSDTIPLIGLDIQMDLGFGLIFAGVVQSFVFGFDAGVPGPRAKDHLISTISGTDYTWLLNRYLPFGSWVNISIGGIIAQIVSQFAPGFALNMTGSYPPATISFNRSSTFTQCLNTLTDLAGKEWKVDYQMTLNVFDE